MQGKALYFVLACAVLGCAAAGRALRQNNASNGTIIGSIDAPANSTGYVVEGAMCNCNRAYNPVCGLDLQTYPNQCVMECGGVFLKSVGKCDPICYPPRDP